MRYYVIAGEASGDLHASNLIRSLLQLDTGAQVRAWGGDLSEEASATLAKHYRDLAFMGFTEVLKNIFTILSNIRFCKSDILNFRPDALILIDYPGFNLRIAKWAKEQGIKVFYYISPQIWAWHSSRVKNIKRDVDRMYVILPFEKDFYAKYDYPVEFVGHPLLDAILPLKKDPGFLKKHHLSDKKIIALLPGSRKQEISKMLDVMMKVAGHYPDYQFVIAGAPSIPPDFYNHITASADIPVVRNETHQLLLHATAALVTSGTATLETALFDVPQVVCYKGNPISYSIARRLVNIKYISLVNLITDSPLVKELIQNELTPENLRLELDKILLPENAASMRQGYAHLRTLLGNPGASARTANLIYEAVYRDDEGTMNDER